MLKQINKNNHYQTEDTLYNFVAYQILNFCPHPDDPLQNVRQVTEIDQRQSNHTGVKHSTTTMISNKKSPKYYGRQRQPCE